MRSSLLRVAATSWLVLATAGCATCRDPGADTPAAANVLKIPAVRGAVRVDGLLDEPCYRRAGRIADFVIVGDATRKPAATSARLLWNADGFVFAFDCEDTSLVVAPSTARERDVDPQDRVELFLWSGHGEDGYFCIEISACGAVHDYRARFYRQFDDSWAPGGWECAVKTRSGGYCVEARLPRAALEGMGFHLRAGERWRAGLFRADFVPGNPDSPDWITWVDARTPEPDFHVAEAFGTLLLRR